VGSILSPENVPVMTNIRGSPLADVFPLAPDDSRETQSLKVEQALCKIFGDWNKIVSNFKTVHQEIDSAAKSKTKFCNSVTCVIGNMQDATKETDIQVQSLQASLGGQEDPCQSGKLLLGQESLDLGPLGSATEIFITLMSCKETFKSGRNVGEHGRKLH
jgi:hypothetical protein